MAIRKQFASLWDRLFGDSARAFGTLALVLLVLLAIVPARDHFREWYRYQKGYLRLIRGRDDAVTLQRRLQAGVQQTWIPELNVVDRCSSCHVAMKETGLRGVGTQPYRPHPTIPHTLDQFGCVMCHRGQGVATSVEEAHRSTKAWEQPILPARYFESSCGQCHTDKLTGTPRLNAGRTLLTRYGCVHCHSLTLPDGSRLTPTDDPPSLAHVADKTTREWIYAWIKNPQAYSETATMPNFQLSDADARDISAFVVAQSAPLAAPLAPAASAARSDAEALQAGASAYGESFCASCHAMQNAAGLLVGGDLGPELTRIGTKAKPEWLRQWVRNPKAYDPGTAMPHYRLDEKLLSLITAFLEGKTDPDFMANVHLEPATAQQVAHGKLLVTEMGCAICHEINGLRKPEDFAPDLTLVGARPLAKIVFLPGMPRALPSYLEAKIKQPRSFGSALKMPQFTIPTSQVDDLVTALLAQTDRASTLPARLHVAGRTPSSYEPAGTAGRLMRDLNCFSCHSINGRGGDMAPDLSWEGSAVQHEWLFKFFKDPNTLRPALIRRMPKFNLTDQEANSLTDFILTAYQTPAFERDSMHPDSDPTAIEQGRQLFYSKYACQACHIVDPKKDKGYVGPTLTQVGSRLNAAWVFQWLKGPQALRPGTLEPDWKMSDSDAASLTAFLMAQKGKAASQEGAHK
ncbi:MAG TPA: c-type cytochrome [Bryobacteraceae bacterium]|nr:c-type cytochrome [Bryobacteraceae bacterium]